MCVSCLRGWSTFTIVECLTAVWSPVTVWWMGVLSWRSQIMVSMKFWTLKGSLTRNHLKTVRELTCLNHQYSVSPGRSVIVSEQETLLFRAIMDRSRDLKNAGTTRCLRHLAWWCVQLCDHHARGGDQRTPFLHAEPVSRRQERHNKTATNKGM